MIDSETIAVQLCGMQIELNHSKFLTNVEQIRLKRRLEEDHSKEALMIQLLFTYGMRGGELRSLRVCDINHDEKTMHIKGQKGSRSRTFPLALPLFKRLTAISKTLSDEDLVFPVSRFQLMRIWDDYKPIFNKTLHCLRHSAAIRLYQEHKDIQLVQNILGHRNLTTTLIYQQHVYDTEKYREVFDV